MKKKLVFTFDGYAFDGFDYDSFIKYLETITNKETCKGILPNFNDFQAILSKNENINDFQMLVLSRSRILVTPRHLLRTELNYWR